MMLIVSEFWELESKIEVSAELVPSESCSVAVSQLLLAIGITEFEDHNSSFCLHHQVVFSLCVFISSSLTICLYKDTISK